MERALGKGGAPLRAVVQVRGVGSELSSAGTANTSRMVAGSELSSVAPKLSNYASMDAPFKAASPQADTPTGETIDVVAPKLAASAGSGQKILGSWIRRTVERFATRPFL